jgi:hypothetical protein
MGPNRTTERSHGQQGTRLGGELGPETGTCTNNFDKRMFSAVTIDYFDTIYPTRSCIVSARIPSATWIVS